jgi:hypothetical protein
MSFTKAVVVACALFLFGCGGGGGGGGGGGPAPATNLAGTWSGQLEDPVLGMHTVQVTVDATGKMTQLKQDGIVVIGGNGLPLTGNIVVAGTNLYSFTLSDGTKGGFFADASATHVAFLDEDTNIGVLQKGATLPLPAFAAADVVGSWTGYNVDLDVNFNITNSFASSVTVNNDGTRTFSGTDAVSGAFSGNLGGTVDTAFGRWTGPFTQGAVAGVVHVFLSSDKLYAGTWNCPNAAVDFIADCTFSAWHK